MVGGSVKWFMISGSVKEFMISGFVKDLGGEGKEDMTWAGVPQREYSPDR